jgi:hypothetical protein
MNEQQPENEEQPIERGAAEEASGVPLTPTEDDARRTPPSTPEQTTDQTNAGQ